MSSSDWPWQLGMGGVFSSNPVHSPFATYNKVLLGYCSSDAYMADVPASPATWGFAFRGRRILAAALTQLVQQHQLGAPIPGGARKPRLILGGCSAGARGAMVNADAVQSWLTNSSLDMDYRLLLDSNMWMAFPPINPNIPSLAAQTQAALEAYGANTSVSLLGDSCLTAFPDTTWKCAMGQFRMPFISQPYVLNAAQFDAFQLSYDVGGTPPAAWNATLQSYALEYQQASKAALQPLPTFLQPNSSVFSTACFKHCLTDSSALWAIKIGGLGAPVPAPRQSVYSLRDMLFSWMDGAYKVPGIKAPVTGPPPEQATDTCTGFRCGVCRTRGRGEPGKQKVKRADAVIEAQELEEAQSSAQVTAATQGRLEARQEKVQQRQAAREYRKEQSSSASTKRIHAMIAIAVLLTLAVFGVIASLANSLAKDPDRVLMSLMAAERAPPDAGMTGSAARSDSPDRLFGQGYQRVDNAAAWTSARTADASPGYGQATYTGFVYGGRAPPSSGYGAIPTQLGGGGGGGLRQGPPPTFVLPQGLSLASPGLDRWTPGVRRPPPGTAMRSAADARERL